MSAQFSDWLKKYQGGALDDKLTAALREVASNVKLLEKPGAITLKLKLGEKGGGIVVEAEVAQAVPKPKQSGQFFYVADDGTLTRRDPSQPQLPSMEDQTNE
jgi:hypothetical protein